MYALDLDTDGRILSVTYPRFAPADAVTVEALPEGDVSEYRYVGGEFIHDPLSEQTEPEAPNLEDRVATLEEALEMILMGVTE